MEPVNIFQEYEDEICVVGGWGSDLMFLEENNVGSVDVDIMAGMYGGTQLKRRSQHVQGTYDIYSKV